MPRTSSVSEHVWARAIYAVMVEKLSLRRAAQLYGVHHMSLHRRVRGQHGTNSTSQRVEHCGQLSLEDEHIGSVECTSEQENFDKSKKLQSKQWINQFRACKKVSSKEQMSQPPPPPFAVQHPQYPQSYQIHHSQIDPKVYHDHLPRNTPNSIRSILNHSSYLQDEMEQQDSTSESDSEYQCSELTCTPINRLSNKVPVEIWERAIDAVETQGMSLRNAAKMYRVHFAALYRRVKKRAIHKEQVLVVTNYIPFEDEAGIIRVVHARADLGILMTYEELVDLLNRTAHKHMVVTPDISQSIVFRFQTRVEQRIRNLIQDWPLPKLESIYSPSCTGRQTTHEEEAPAPVCSHQFMYNYHDYATATYPISQTKPVLRSNIYSVDGKVAIERAPTTSMIRL